MKLRILLIDIDFLGQTEGQLLSQWSHHPIGLLYLAAAVRQAHSDVEIQIFHTITRDNPLQEIKTLIHEFNPSLVGLRSLSINQTHFKSIARCIRQWSPKAHLIAGGPYPSCSYGELLREQYIDLAVIGEGERTLVELVGMLQKNGRLPQDLNGSAVLGPNGVKRNLARDLVDDLDALPFPAYDLINLKDYAGISNHSFQDASRSAFICSSRGCPYHCCYCHQLFGKQVRRRSEKKILEEMRTHVEERGVVDFVFVDDIFNVPMAHAKEVLRSIKKELPGIHLNFPNGLRADQMDDELIGLLEDAGTVHMALAVETATPRLQRMIRKNLDLGKAKRAIQAASKRFVVCCFFMVGFPTETFEEAMSTIRFAADLDSIVQPILSVVRVYPGTPLYGMLGPNELQAKALAGQEQKPFQPKILGETGFYGDFFEDEKVPLCQRDIKRLQWRWMQDVFSNRRRIVNAHRILSRYFDVEQILKFYRLVYDAPDFDERSLDFLLEGGALMNQHVVNE